MSDDKKGLIGEDEQAPPAVVRAEREVRDLGLKLGATGALGTLAYWLLTFQIGFPLLPLSWWGFFLIGLVLYFFFPQTREARRAREVLRRWDEAEVRGILESSGSTSDPRLQAAQNMTARIVQHPGTTAATQDIVQRLMERLAQTTQDQRLVEIAMQAEARSVLEDPAGRTLSDALDHLEVRAGKLLGALAELHGAVVDRDASEVSRVLTQASDVLLEWEAVREVEKLLQQPEHRGGVDPVDDALDRASGGS